MRDKIQEKLFEISHQVSNSLAMLKKVPGVKKGASENEAFPEYGKMKDGFPSWVSPKDRKLLQAAVNETKFDLVVAKDGSGKFTTIGEAVAAAPNSSTTRQVLPYPVINNDTYYSLINMYVPFYLSFIKKVHVICFFYKIEN